MPALTLAGQVGECCFDDAPIASIGSQDPYYTRILPATPPATDRQTRLADCSAQSPPRPSGSKSGTSQGQMGPAEMATTTTRPRTSGVNSAGVSAEARNANVAAQFDDCEPKPFLGDRSHAFHRIRSVPQMLTLQSAAGISSRTRKSSSTPHLLGNVIVNRADRTDQAGPT